MGKKTGGHSGAPKISVCGYIVPMDVNRFGRPTGIGIETHNFERYGLQEGYKSQMLCSHIFNEAVVSGELAGRDSDGVSVIKIDTFQIIRHTDKMEDLQR